MNDAPSSPPPDDPRRMDELFDRVMSLLASVEAMAERQERVEALLLKIALGQGISLGEDKGHPGTHHGA
jgi:hypothetical protein